MLTVASTIRIGIAAKAAPRCYSLSTEARTAVRAFAVESTERFFQRFVRLFNVPSSDYPPPQAANRIFVEHSGVLPFHNFFGKNIFSPLLINIYVYRVEQNIFTLPDHFISSKNKRRMKDTRSYILVAEDDEDDQFLLREAFNECQADCRLEFVGDGAELMNYLDDCLHDPGCLPSLILLDLNMPKKNGRQALLEIKGHEKFQIIPVVMVTTSKNVEDMTFCQQAGAAQYVVKPAQFSELVTHADSLLRQWVARSANSVDSVS
jgi:CheY-like chemotaxis protein